MNHGVLDQIPRSSLVLLLVAQAAVIAPHVPRLPLWIVALWGLCVLWRVCVYLGRWSYPGTLVKGGLILLAAVGVGLGYGQLYGLDPTSALLVIAFSLKLLEMAERRDALVLIYLAYFVIGVQFLYEQAMAAAGYQLLATGLVTAALVGLNQSWSRPRWVDSLRTAGVLLLQAVPLTVVIFLFFPRIAPLWSVPLPDPTARTGLADSMSPGEIAELGRSPELAFRVEFEGAIPSQAELYWRALTYSEYREGTWSGGARLDSRQASRLIDWGGLKGTPEPWLERLELGERSLEYSVIVEPTYRPWLFALDFAEPLSPRVGIGRDFRLVAREPITTRSRYEVRSHVGTRLDPVLPDWLRERSLELPVGGDTRTRSFVQDLVAQGFGGAALAEQLLSHFRSEPFFYTLSPPTLSGDRIDQFLFETRRGFCAHYAGAFVFMMRAAGVPARVVAGYQGGELNPLASHLIVRQYDAHAWAEIWLDGLGWVRVDPTAAVAPERIERGAEAALTAESDAADLPFMPEGLRSLTWAMDALYFLDSLEYRWNVLVLSYDADRQSEVLTELLGEVTPTRIAIAVTIAGGLAVGLAGIGTLLTSLRRRRPPLLRVHDALVGAFGAAGFPRSAHESPRCYAERVAQAYPELAEDLRFVATSLDGALFDPAAGEADVARLLRRVRSLRLRLALDRLRRTLR
ncbi:MAG: DUF3488 and transglutaminase-like domain-containing protein [Pseudomonadales bacterium]|nr:DUF3488 and transglutaminase-like domain-containing protein [Pseudomonadales bacterium]